MNQSDLTLLWCKQYIDKQLANFKGPETADTEKHYPVGAIFLSTVATNPADLFGFGTWEQIKDRFLLAAGDTYAAGATGGEATHKLTVDEMPKISGTANFRNGVNPGSFRPTGVFSESAGGHESLGLSTGTTTEEKKLNLAFGGDQPHNNMPPYLAVYVWVRIE